MRPALKHPNKPLLSTVLVANLGLFIVLITTNQLTIEGTAIWKASHLLVPASVTLILAGVLSAQISSEMKARLIFFRWRHPLPGCRAFTTVALRDPRVSMRALEAKLGTLPSEPDAQNQAWYGLYREIKDQPPVVQVHQSFLNYRDCTTLIALLAVPMIAVAAWTVRPWTTAMIYALIIALQLLLVWRAAAVRGTDLVSTVLAIASAGGAPAKKKRKAR